MKAKMYGMLGDLVGVVATLIYCYFNPHLIALHAKSDPKFRLKAVKSIIETNDSLRDATAIMSTQSASAYGKEFHNTLTSDGRRSIITHPCKRIPQSPWL